MVPRAAFGTLASGGQCCHVHRTACRRRKRPGEAGRGKTRRGGRSPLASRGPGPQTLREAEGPVAAPKLRAGRAAALPRPGLEGSGGFGAQGRRLARAGRGSVPERAAEP